MTGNTRVAPAMLVNTGPPPTMPVITGPPPVMPVINAPPPVMPVINAPPPVMPVINAPPPVMPVINAPPPVMPVITAPPPVMPVITAPPPVMPVNTGSIPFWSSNIVHPSSMPVNPGFTPASTMYTSPFPFSTVNTGPHPNMTVNTQLAPSSTMYTSPVPFSTVNTGPHPNMTINTQLAPSSTMYAEHFTAVPADTISTIASTINTRPDPFSIVNTGFAFDSSLTTTVKTSVLESRSTGTKSHSLPQNNGIADSINEHLQGIDLSELKKFQYLDLAEKTGNFCDLWVEEGGYKIGEGGFGSVFRADISVAVKLLKEPVDKQFFTELSILSRCKHENLLRLLGFSVDGSNCCSVYEYMPNGSLEDRLACSGGSLPLPSLTRLHIAYFSAVGLNYLHNFSKPPLVHRDVKSANILLDENFIPKIGDFGLVRIGGSGSASTMAITKHCCGTEVYMAREARYGDVSVKLDTFSFGVVLLEILTGLPPYDIRREDRDLVTHMEDCEDILTMLDQKVLWNEGQAIDMYKIANQCLIYKKKQRPTIGEILPDLESLLNEFDF
ncbi:interleukin-1 receptor-associated kinase 4-like [Argiope bruennichi]|uniref:interleukin-1 receptor-associated kinase 4-like n=1 Tax=Argiope bruennichi TaxID=94029 RepID=UPI0024942CD3|nr:interleukin-1 receptor-associated kinase 4-like [Argiope bruennichi]XP_055944301.1 interleukin-1 receptor-associated kinase 4-like [Argiope bruennichi]